MFQNVAEEGSLTAAAAAAVRDGAAGGGGFQNVPSMQCEGMGAF